MENKYYTPEIEELHVGMYCEWLRDPANEIYIPIELTANMLSLTLNTTGWNFEKLNVPGPISYRVKYLDREDIESLGWVYKYSEEDKPCICYTNKNVDIIFNPRNNWVLITKGDGETTWSDWKTIFAGNIKNKSELKRVMEQLTINKL
jgi:hypothetical protein